MNKLKLTPMNCCTTSLFNSKATFDGSIYDSISDRAILFYDYNISKFKIKNITASLDIGKEFYGLNIGDSIDISFYAYSDSETNVSINSAFLKQDGSQSSTLLVYRQTVDTYKKLIKIRVPVKIDAPSGFIGMYIGLANSTKNSEVTIEDVEIKVNTLNSDFSVKNDNIIYDSDGAFKRVLKTCKTNSKDYKTIETYFNDGTITINNNIFKSYNTTVKAGAKGIVSELLNSTNKQVISIYVEYKNANSNSFSLKCFSKDVLVSNNFLPVSSEFRKEIRYIQIDNTKQGLTIFAGVDSSLSDFEINKLVINICNADMSIDDKHDKYNSNVLFN